MPSKPATITAVPASVKTTAVVMAMAVGAGMRISGPPCAAVSQ
ncbi:MAG TPA: hypothetical protein VMH87_14830 [Pseudomonadales bacterium]|nr:hypothetical protein [Pseudomonadales bacterium]